MGNSNYISISNHYMINQTQGRRYSLEENQNEKINHQYQRLYNNSNGRNKKSLLKLQKRRKSCCCNECGQAGGQMTKLDSLYDFSVIASHKTKTVKKINQWLCRIAANVLKKAHENEKQLRPLQSMKTKDFDNLEDQKFLQTTQKLEEMSIDNISAGSPLQDQILVKNEIDQNLNLLLSDFDQEKKKQNNLTQTKSSKMLRYSNFNTQSNSPPPPIQFTLDESPISAIYESPKNLQLSKTQQFMTNLKIENKRHSNQFPTGNYKSKQKSASMKYLVHHLNILPNITTSQLIEESEKKRKQISLYETSPTEHKNNFSKFINIDEIVQHQSLNKCYTSKKINPFNRFISTIYTPQYKPQTNRQILLTESSFRSQKIDLSLSHNFNLKKKAFQTDNNRLNLLQNRITLSKFQAHFDNNRNQISKTPPISQ